MNFKILLSSLFLGVFILTAGLIKPDDVSAWGGSYTSGLGWATLTYEAGQPSNEIKWETYIVPNTGAVQSSVPGMVNITYKQGASQHVFGCGIPGYPSCSSSSFTITLPAGGDWTSDSYIWRSGAFNFVEDLFAGPINFSSGGGKVIKVYQTATAWRMTDSIQPSVRNRWYYNANDGNFLQTLAKPTIQLVSGPGSPQAQIKNATLRHGAIGDAHIQVIGPQTLPDGSGGSTLSYSGSGFSDGWKYMWGYLQFSNGSTPTESGSFTDMIIGIDRQLPTISCQLYKMDGVTPLTTINQNGNLQTAEPGMKVKVTAVDQAGLSGVGTGEIWLQKAGGGYVKVGGAGNSSQDILPGGSGNIDSMVTVDLPITVPGEIDNGQNLFNLRFRARDNAYGSAGLQDHWSSWNYCGGTDTVPVEKDDINIVVSQYKLYTDSARTSEITPTTSLEPGVGTIYGRIIVENKSQSCIDSTSFKIAHYREDSIPPNPDLGSTTVDAQLSLLYLPSEGSFVRCGGLSNVSTWDTFEFPTPSTIGPKTSYAFADFEGTITESNDGTPTTHGDNLVRVDYFVGSDQWFSATGADVGAAGDLRVSVDPPPGAQSSFMLIQGGNSSPSSSSLNWKLSNYKRNLYPQVGGTHASSLFNHLWPKIQDSVSGDYDTGNVGFNDPADRKVCDQHQGGTTFVGSNEANFWNQYKSFVIRCYDNGDSDETWSDPSQSSSAQPSGNNVYVIDGDLVLDGDYTCCGNDGSTALCNSLPGGCLNMFIVKGDMTVSTDATEIDGVFIVGGTFKDYSGSDIIADNKLTVNGAIYAKEMDLKRKLSTGSSTTPALEVVYNPSLYFVFEKVCGEEISGSGRNVTCYSLGGRELDWRETAP